MDEDTLRAWIQEHRVCWELSPRFELHGPRRLQVGFDLTLFARHPDTFEDKPGCEACWRHYETLREIALAVLPKSGHPMFCQVAPFDAAVHLRSETSWTLEIELTVAILHRGATFAEVDADDRRCVGAIQEELRKLGARPRMWSGVENLNRAR
jgi:hypothetical protein